MESDEPLLKSVNDVMETLFISKNGSDVTFVVHGKELQAHKFIVIARSSVFKAMIEGPLAKRNQNPEINDPKVTFEEFENFLRFLYTDKFEFDLKKSDIEALIHLCKHVFVIRIVEHRILSHLTKNNLGSFYDVPYFLEKCAKYIDVSKITIEKAYEYAELALNYAPALLQKCFDCFRNNCFDATLSYKIGDGTIKWISSALALTIVKDCRRNTKIFEDSIFKNIFTWAEHHFVQQNERQPTPDDIQKLVTSIIPFFHLNDVSPLSLAITIKEKKFIPNEEVVNYLAKHIVERSWVREHYRNVFDIRNERTYGYGGRDLDQRYHGYLPVRGGRGRGR